MTAAVLAALTLGLAGCQEPPSGGFRPATLSPLAGEVFSRMPLVAAPGRNFLPTEDGEAWEFRLSATVTVRILRPVEEPLRFYFQPGPEESDLWFRLFWDGQEIGGGGGGNEVRARVPAELLTEGDHDLLVHRLYADRPVGEVRLDTFGYRLGERDHPFAPAEAERLRYLEDFLSVGLTGEGQQKYGGILMAGPGSARQTLPVGSPGHLHFQLQNRSQAPAEFVVRVADRTARQELPAGESRPLRMPLPTGDHSLELEVSGDEEGLFLWGEPAVEPEAASDATPILLITLDTTRRDALSPYGGSEAITPHIAAFARQATVYEKAYSTSPWTLPSHASIMTGLYPSHHQAGVEEQYLTAEASTLAEHLGEVGYLTAGFAGGALCAHRFGVGQGFGRYLNPESFETPGDRLTNAVDELLSRRSRQPLFLFVNYFDPHAMYKAPPKFLARAGVPEKRKALPGHPLWRALDLGRTHAWRKIIDGEGEVTPELLEYLRAVYLSEVAFMDEQIGRLFERLRELKLYDRALIILVADHGELLGEYGGLFSHAGRLDPELTEIPLLIKWPGQQEGRRDTSLASQVDLFATVLDVAGLDVAGLDVGGLEAQPRDGRSLASDGSRQSRRVLFMEEHESRVHPLPRRLKIAPHVFGVQRDEQRLVVWEDGLECAAATPVGWRDEPCTASPEAVLERVEKTLGASKDIEGAGEVDREAREALKALGYI